MMNIKDKVIFVSGIDTNIGKTYATAFLLKTLKDSGYKAISQKFIQTGNIDRSEDIDKHNELQGIEQGDIDELYNLRCPIIMSYPASPHLSAKIDKVEINLDLARNATRRLIEEYMYDIVLLEGAGGLMVPIKDDYLTIDYIKENNYPVALVSNGKLGSINHTLLSIDALKSRDINLSIFVYNRYPKQDAIIEEDTEQYLREYLAKHSPDTQFISIDYFEKL